MAKRMWDKAPSQEDYQLPEYELRPEFAYPGAFVRIVPEGGRYYISINGSPLGRKTRKGFKIRYYGVATAKKKASWYARDTYLLKRLGVITNEDAAVLDMKFLSIDNYTWEVLNKHETLADRFICRRIGDGKVETYEKTHIIAHQIRD